MQTYEQSFDRPIPGQSLTAELGSRPWQQPYELTDVEKTAEYYIAQIANDKFSKALIHTMKTGVPLTTIANSMQLVGVMEGKHSVDVGILVLPVIMETMMLIGDSAGVEYTSGLEEGKELDQDVLAVAAIDKMINNSSNSVEKETDTKKEEQVIIEDKPVEEKVSSGLMARRV